MRTPGVAWAAAGGVVTLLALLAFLLGRWSGDARDSARGYSPLGAAEADLAAERAAAEREALREWVVQQMDERLGAGAEPAAGGPDLAPLTKRLAALERQLVVLEKLSARLERLEKRPAGSPAPAAGAADAAALDALRSRLVALEARISGSAPPAAAADRAGSDSSSLHKRVYDVEVRQEREEARRVQATEDLLKRMHEVEQRGSDSISRWDSDLRSVLQRLESAENRLENLGG